MHTHSHKTKNVLIYRKYNRYFWMLVVLNVVEVTELKAWYYIIINHQQLHKTGIDSSVCFSFTRIIKQKKVDLIFSIYNI